jgi:glycosyltransferase involved in cell wall biosynthesis
MLILMTIDAMGGVFRYAIELASWLVARDVEVVFASMGRALSPAQRHELAARRIVLEESEYRLEWMDEPWHDVETAGSWLLSLEEKYRPDIVHLNGFAHGALGFRAPVVVVAHSSVLSWWRAVFGSDAPASFDRYRAEVTRGLRGATRIVAPSHAMLYALLEHEPWLERELERATLSRALARVLVIENAVGSEHFVESEKEEYVFTASRVWDQAKNVALLRHVAPNVAWPIQVAGEYDAKASATFAGSGVSLLGALRSDELFLRMAAAGIYVAPALYEPFGLSVLEAAAAGTALVLGDIPSFRELWGSSAIFADPRDAAVWSHAVQRLIEQPALRERLGASARARARRFSLERMGQAYLALYRKLEKQRAGDNVYSLGVAS